MTTATDRVVLSTWNGRPTVSIDVVDSQPLLSWLLLGHVEDFDVWLRATLTWAQADELCTARPGGFDLGGYLSRQGGTLARYELFVEPHGLVAEMSGPMPVGSDVPREMLRKMFAKIRVQLEPAIEKSIEALIA